MLRRYTKVEVEITREMQVKEIQMQNHFLVKTEQLKYSHKIEEIFKGIGGKAVANLDKNWRIFFWY